MSLETHNLMMADPLTDSNQVLAAWEVCQEQVDVRIRGCEMSLRQDLGLERGQY